MSYTRIATILGLVTAVIIASAIWFGYFYRPYDRETACTEIPSGSVVLVSGFDYRLGTNGEALPGAGNQFLAQKLVDCAERLAAVVTQQAVLEALTSQGALRGGKLNGVVPVYAMHQHRADTPVRTLQSLTCALNRLTPLPGQLVVLAHDKHQQRVVQDLRSIFNGEIVEWQVIDVPYATEKPFAPIWWALRELLVARPAEAFLRWARQRPLLPSLVSIANLLGGNNCPENVVIKENVMYEAEEKANDADFDEDRRHWEGVHNDEAAQYRVMFEDTSAKELAACCILPGAGITAVFLAAIYGLIGSY